MTNSKDQEILELRATLAEAERRKQKLKEALKHCIKEYPLYDSKEVGGSLMIDYMKNVLAILYRNTSVTLTRHVCFNCDGENNLWTPHNDEAPTLEPCEICNGEGTLLYDDEQLQHLFPSLETVTQIKSIRPTTTVLNEEEARAFEDIASNPERAESVGMERVREKFHAHTKEKEVYMGPGREPEVCDSVELVSEFEIACRAGDYEFAEEYKNEIIRRLRGEKSPFDFELESLVEITDGYARIGERAKVTSHSTGLGNMLLYKLEKIPGWWPQSSLKRVDDNQGER
jgi:hypothetical protein